MIAGHALPDSIAEIARRAAAGVQPFDYAVREFLDCWQTMDGAARCNAILAEPCHVKPLEDAYLAALAEHVAVMERLPVPDWTEQPERFLGDAILRRRPSIPQSLAHRREPGSVPAATDLY